MSTPNKYDLILLGNVILDNVYCVPKWAEPGTSSIFYSHRESVGGIGNIIESLSGSNLQITVETMIGKDSLGKVIKRYFKNKSIKTKLHYSNKPTSQALVVSNLKSKERTGFVNWGCAADLFTPMVKKSKWAHILYLDTLLLDWKKIKKNATIISADLCLSNPSAEIIDLVLKQLHYLDYLFVSETELPSLINNLKIEDLINKYKLKCIIFHTRSKTFIYRKGSCIEINSTHSIIENIDVLGAGDAYCANFIFYQLNYERNDEKAVIWAHEQATKFISQRKI